MLGALEISLPARDIVGYAFGLGTLAILLEAIWRRPDENAEAEAEHEVRRFSRVKINALLTTGLVLLWGLRVANMMPAFWLLACGARVWPLADRLTRRAVEHLLRPPGTAEVTGSPSLLAVFARARSAGGADHRRAGDARLGLGHRYREPGRRETMMTRIGARRA